MKLSYNLQWYVDKMKAGEKFSLARYGDGELYCIWGRSGKNSNGCYYYPELRDALIESLVTPKENFIYGLQRVLPHDEKRIMKEYPSIEWHDTEIFSEAVANGELYPFIEQLKKMQLHFIGNDSINEFIDKTFPGDPTPERWNLFTTVQPSNAYLERKAVIDAILKNDKPNKVYLFSCGMAANAFIYELHGKIDGWLLDVGHIWDPFTGNMSRCDLEGKTLEDINKNLHAKTE